MMDTDLTEPADILTIKKEINEFYTNNHPLVPKNFLQERWF
jgi:hypothetical protein